MRGIVQKVVKRLCGEIVKRNRDLKLLEEIARRNWGDMEIKRALSQTWPMARN